jgi:hypothetical protein
MVQSVNKHMSGDIFVSLRGGTYPLSQTLTFRPIDSGTNGYNIIYEAYAGEKLVISGGQTITSWTLNDHNKNIWQATVGTKLQTRQLYVNGVRAIRARSSGGLPGRVTQTSTGYTERATSFLGSTIVDNRCCDPHQNAAHEERGSRGRFCDRSIFVTNLPPRPSFFVQATESTFRVCVTQHSGERIFHKKKLSQGGLP